MELTHTNIQLALNNQKELGGKKITNKRGKKNKNNLYNIRNDILGYVAYVGWLFRRNYVDSFDNLQFFQSRKRISLA